VHELSLGCLLRGHGIGVSTRCCILRLPHSGIHRSLLSIDQRFQLLLLDKSQLRVQLGTLTQLVLCRRRCCCCAIACVSIDVLEVKQWLVRAPRSFLCAVRLFITPLFF
jgi:hypothetical protein